MASRSSFDPSLYAKTQFSLNKWFPVDFFAESFVYLDLQPVDTYSPPAAAECAKSACPHGIRP